MTNLSGGGVMSEQSGKAEDRKNPKTEKAAGIPQFRKSA
jgi:hypothetical protein